MLTVAAALTTAPAMPAMAQDGAASEQLSAAESLNTETTTDADRARLLGLLEYRAITVDFDKTPAREAFATLRRFARIPLVVRWTDDTVGMGIDPETPISVSAAGQSVRETLEAMLDQCSAAGIEECTWQLRRGFVEAGTKKRLSVPAAREMRLYEIRDLMIEPPTFSSDDNFRVRMFRDQIDPQHKGQTARPNDPGSRRKTPQALAVELVEEVCETIEPGHWDFGQPIELDDREDDARVEPRPVGGSESTPTTAPDAGGPADGATPGTTAPRTPRRNKDLSLWATIRTWRDQLIVVAPDFIHRQIGGYPKAIVPDDADLVDRTQPVDEEQRP